MSSAKPRNLPVRILRIWFDIVLVLGVIAAVIFVGWLALSPFLMARGGFPADATVQVVVGPRSLFSIHPVEFVPTVDDREALIMTANLVDARGELRLTTSSWSLHFASLGSIMLATWIILYLIWMVRKVLINVLDDRPFDAANGTLLRRCGYTILILGAVWPIFDYALSNYVLSRIDVTNIDLQPAIIIEKDVFVVGLLFLVFGLILTRGHELQEHEQALEEEQALTV